MDSYDVDNCFAAERHNQIRDQARAFAEAEIHICHGSLAVC